jgi:hypothetical protein
MHHNERWLPSPGYQSQGHNRLTASSAGLKDTEGATADFLNRPRLVIPQLPLKRQGHFTKQPSPVFDFGGNPKLPATEQHCLIGIPSGKANTSGNLLIVCQLRLELFPHPSAIALGINIFGIIYGQLLL